ncbi:MAG: response regulator [Ktedonobacteraceae bacterium]
MDKQGRILILEDLKPWREQLVETLRRGGFYVESVSTVAAALDCLNKSFYHLLVVDIRMEEGNTGNEEGIDLLSELDKRGLSETITVIIHSAYGTQERMRQAFRFHGVADFLSKDRFDKDIFLGNVQQVFSEKVNVNLELTVHWQQISGPDQAVLNLEIDGARIQPDTPLQNQMAKELNDLLCRLFYQAKSLLVRPLTAGRSGTGVLRVQPFYTSGGGGYEVVVKFGETAKIEKEYANFKKYVQPFLGGGRNTTVIDVRLTPHLGGIIYSLLGTVNDQLADFGDFYHRAAISKITNVLDRLFHETCGAWYANSSQLEPLDLSMDYHQLLGHSPEILQQMIAEELPAVKGKQTLTFSRLKTKRTFTNPLLAIAGQSLVHSTYRCITHGDFNPHNLLVDSTGYMWMIDFQETGQSHILRDIAMFDSVVRFQLLTAEEATLKERLSLEKALCSIKRFSQVQHLLEEGYSTTNEALAKVYATVVHLRLLAHTLVKQKPNDDMSEYYIALLYNALNTLQFFSLSQEQREHALLCASLLADQLGLSS